MRDNRDADEFWPEPALQAQGSFVLGAMPASAGTVCASGCLAFVVCIMNYASMDADFIDQSLRPDLIRLIQCIMTMQKLTMWEEQANFLCELRGIMSVCVASWDDAKAMFSLPATYPPVADYAWPVAAARPMAKLLEDQFTVQQEGYMFMHFQDSVLLTQKLLPFGGDEFGDMDAIFHAFLCVLVFAAAYTHAMRPQGLASRSLRA